MRLRRFWTALLFWLYAAAVLELLHEVAPVYLDSGGPIPSLHWGTTAHPSLKEYGRHRLYYDSLFALPYAGTALAITLAGCGLAPTLARRLRPKHYGCTTAALALGCLLLFCLGSDLGTALGIWSGPVFLCPVSYSVQHVLSLATALLPPAAMAGLVARLAPYRILV